jgi:hypothetical protein
MLDGESNATRVLFAGLRQRWFDRLRRSLLSNWDPGGGVHAIFPGTRAPEARGSATRRRSFAAVSRVQLQLFKRIFGRNRTEEPAIADGRLQGLRDDEGMPLICPTCQLFFRSSHAPGRPACYFCMGLFSIFSGALMSTVPLP